MLKLKDSIISNNKFGYANIIIMFDNWSSHISKEVLNYREIWIKSYVLSPYSPQLAPIEMRFNYAKQKQKCMMKFQILNLSNRCSHDRVFWEHEISRQ